MKSIITTKTYYLITHPELPGHWIENYGDRMFIMKYPNSRVTSYMDGVAIGGDIHWEMTPENIHKCANHLLEEKIKEIRAEMEQDEIKARKSYECQDCGHLVGWLGRFFEFFVGKQHKCEGSK